MPANNNVHKSTVHKLVVVFGLFSLVVLINMAILIINFRAEQESQHRHLSNGVMLEPIGRRAKVESPVAKPSTIVGQASAAEAKQTFIPVLLYHKTPDNFEQQLVALRDKGYTTITMAEMYAVITGSAARPSKPAVITFDDGFSDQLKAVELLKKYNMKATFYIIVGGELSNWCIGAERKNTNCGDAYLSWDDIKNIKDSGLIEIGAHTIDHLSLPNQSQAIQRDQIIRSKRIIEEKLGIKVSSFAYPYGRLSDFTAAVVKEAGYTNAAGTTESSMVSIDNIYNIPRIRTTLNLP